MLPDFDKNAAFIWACYAIGLILIGGTILAVNIRARRARTQLTRDETEGAGE